MKKAKHPKQNCQKSHFEQKNWHNKQ